MKRNAWIMTLLLVMSSFSMELVAQKNLDALVKKCETMSSVSMEYVRKKNQQTKKLETKVISITIYNDQALVDEFLDAFKKDEDNVLSVIENKEKGGRFNLFYKFESVSYSIDYMKDKKSASIDVMYKSTTE